VVYIHFWILIIDSTIFSFCWFQWRSSDATKLKWKKSTILTHWTRCRRTRSGWYFCSSGPLCRSRRGRMVADATETDLSPVQTEKPPRMKTATSPLIKGFRKEYFSLTRSCQTRAPHTHSSPCCSTVQELRVASATVQEQLTARNWAENVVNSAFSAYFWLIFFISLFRFASKNHSRVSFC